MKLYSLSTGYKVEECDETNCDNAESIGYNIQKDLDCKSVEEVKVNCNKYVRTLQSIKKAINIECQIYILIHQFFLID